MKNVDYLIIGGSAAGITAAETIRSLDQNGAITIVSDENYVQYSRVLLPHFVRGKVKREQVFLKNPQWYLDKKIELIKGIRAENLEVSSKTIRLSNGEEYQYRKLLITTGGYVIPLNIPGAEFKNILYLRTIEDADSIIKAASQKRKGVIIGGGFIGLEFATSFKANGVENVTILVQENRYWAKKLDEASSIVLSQVLENNGVKIVVNETADHFESTLLKELRGSREKDGQVSSVVTKSGNKFEANVVGVGIGISTELEWLREAGIKVDRGIVTNEYLETNILDIYAAGDCAQFYDLIFNREHIMGNWANATSQGAAVGKTMSGQKTVFNTASSYSISFFDGSCSFIGVTDKNFANEVINRGSVDEKKMTRIFIKSIDGVMRIVGATVINSTADVAPLTTAIKNKVDISAYKEELANASFELNKINN